MYQYVSKNPTESAKSISADKRKKTVTKRQRMFDSSTFHHNRQVSGYIIQKSPLITAVASRTENQCSAGSARRPFNETPSAFSSASPNRLQVSEKRIPEIPPITTAIAPVTNNQYGAGTARLPSNDLLQNFPNALDFINEVFSNNDWKTLVKHDMGIRCHAQVILDNWNKFLLEFLLDNGFKPYGTNQSLTYHRPGSNCAAESPDNSDERRKSQIGKLYSGSSSIRKRREYNSN